ncbi:helicase-related protein [Propionibacteriaceae bacterium Y1685]
MSAPVDAVANADVAPGSVVVVRDEEWVVTGVEATTDGQLLHVQGLSDLVRGTTASFYGSLDNVQPLDPARATLTADDSAGYRRARLWLEATLRKSAIPLNQEQLSVATQALADPLEYQQAAVRQALHPDILRPRVLLADAVGLGKTLEIGMILAELVRRGRGERILIVCPRHVLEQMQHEMWCRFALPFVRLDSVGMQRVKQKLPATRNPFTWYKRVIISIDTLKQERFAADLRRHRWDAVVIDESHNVTNSATQNNRLARILAPNTDALILASATPHNGRPESFAELIRLLEPTAVTPDGELIADEVKRLVIRRHRHSDQVARTVGADWAERKPPQHLLVPASAAENAVAAELDAVWLHPATGESPSAQKASSLFPWTLAKAFLSSPAAFAQTLTERCRRIGDEPTVAQSRELEALRRLITLNEAAFASSGKYARLRQHLGDIGVGPQSGQRVVIFAERVATLDWLAESLRTDLQMSADQVVVLHGGLSDVEQQSVVESFKQAHSPIRVLITGDIASEGVNLHLQCHQLVHYDIPWSLIRIEQRNGRIDRYGQRTPPQITTLLLDPATSGFAGDLRVLSKLLIKEHEAHTALGDAASLMGTYDAGAEEDKIRQVLAGQLELDDVVADADQVATGDGLAALLAQLGQLSPPTQSATAADEATGLYAREVDFLREALAEICLTPGADPKAGGVRWREHPAYGIVEMVPPPDLVKRLEVLPQGYLADRQVTSTLKLATTRQRGKELLADALGDTSDSSWPEAHHLGPLHPVLEWAADRALATLARNEVFVVRGEAEDHPQLLLQGTLTNRRGQVVSTAYVSVAFPNPDNLGFRPTTSHSSPGAMLAAVGFDAGRSNPGPCARIEAFQPLVAAGVQAARDHLRTVHAAAEQAARERVAAWNARAERWLSDADQLAQRLNVRSRRSTITEERELVAAMAPDRSLVRPLLLVLPGDHPVATRDEEVADARQ